MLYTKPAVRAPERIDASRSVRVSLIKVFLPVSASKLVYAPPTKLPKIVAPLPFSTTKPAVATFVPVDVATFVIVPPV